MEWLGLVELFSILSSLLISMDILFCRPTCAIPQSTIHYITRTIINKWLPWTIDISFIQNMLINFYCLLVRKFLVWNSRPKDLTWMSLWINIRSSEGSFTWNVWCMIIWMCLWHGISTISSRSSIQSIINFWNMNWIEPLNKDN